MKNVLFCVLLVVASCAFSLGQTYKVLYSFGTNPSDGTLPSTTAKLALDRHGNLYGVTSAGGTFNGGVIFELSPNGDGSWTESILYDFCVVVPQTCPNGSTPFGSVVLDPRGNLYGVTASGGAACYTGIYGCGVVYELSPPSAGGSWTQTVLYSFCQNDAPCTDGSAPVGTLVFDKLGNLYGATNIGGAANMGTVFELSPTLGSSWTESVLYSFCPQQTCPDGSFPQVGVGLDKDGNIYGTTWQGGTTGWGVIFRLTPGPTWTETVLYTFPEEKSRFIETVSGQVTLDPDGNIYTTSTWINDQDELYQSGDLYRITGSGNVGILPFSAANGQRGPVSGVILDTKRRVLYGSTVETSLVGDVYRLTPPRQVTTLYKFCSLPMCADGKYPSGLVEDASGNLYGMTAEGGIGGANGTGNGVVFEITP